MIRKVYLKKRLYPTLK